MNGSPFDERVQQILDAAAQDQILAWARETVVRNLRKREREQALLVEQDEMNRRDKVLASEQGFKSLGAYRRARERERDRRLSEAKQRGAEAAAKLSKALDFSEAFLKSQFALPDGRRVTWGGASVSDHKKRIDSLTQLSLKVDDDIARHVEVMSLLEATGASCLNDARRSEAAVARGRAKAHA